MGVSIIIFCLENIFLRRIHKTDKIVQTNSNLHTFISIEMGLLVSFSCSEF